jgi:arylsulfatase A-like enzyme
MNSRSNALLALSLSLLAASACGRGGRGAELPATWVWDQDQTLIAPERGSRNSWSGWTVRGDSFQAEGEVAKFILWVKAGGPRDLHVTYTLEGRPAEIIVNNRVRNPPVIEPSLHPRTAIVEAKLRAGMNFLEFRGPGKGRLKVRRVAVDRPDPRAADDLEHGESVTIFLRPGRGTIEWSGAGELSARIRESVSGHFKEGARSLRTRLLSRSVRQEFELAGPGTLTVTALKGHFNVARFAYEENKPALLPEPKRRLAKDPPIFFLLADACQAEHLSIYGYPRATSPNIEAFARDAVIFENAYANASYTRSSVRSLLSGLIPERSAAGNLTRVSDRLPSIPEYLKIKGYRTSIFTSAVTISPTFGFTKGVDDYHQYLAGAGDKSRTRPIDLDAFGRWLDRPGPVFSYIHFIEPHLPILPPPPFLDMFSGTPGRKPLPPGERLMALMEHPTSLRRPFTPAEVQEVVNDYDSTIAYVDSEIGRALGHIKKAGLYDESLIVVLADHGEAMYEHKAWGHSRNVYEETTHIPLVVKFPASMNLKGRVPKLVQLTDVFPTLADLFGQRIAFPGKSLFEAVADPAVDDTCAVSQSIAETGQFGVRWRRWYYIYNLGLGREKLFDLESDPRTEVRADADGVKGFFKAMFLDWLARSNDAPDTSTAIDLKTLTPAEIESLKTLGYI